MSNPTSRKADTAAESTAAARAFTPGPWLYEGGRTVFALNSKGVNRFYVQVQIGRDNNGELTQPAELHANARLIAAAPELLAALEKAAKVINGMYLKSLPACFAPTTEFVNEINFAIHKAQGASELQSAAGSEKGRPA